jgi:hypothetical protein
VSRNWIMSRAEQQVAEVQSQQGSLSYIVRENRNVSQRALVHARFRERAQDYGARACPSGLNGREYHLSKVPLTQCICSLLCNLQSRPPSRIQIHGSCAFYAIRLLASARIVFDVLCEFPCSSQCPASVFSVQSLSKCATWTLVLLIDDWGARALVKT